MLERQNSWDAVVDVITKVSKTKPMLLRIFEGYENLPYL